MTDGSEGIVENVNDDTLELETGLSGGTNNVFTTGDSYRVRMPANSTSTENIDVVFGPLLIDFSGNFVATGIRIGDTIYNETLDDWGIITGVNPLFVTASDVAFSPGHAYVIRYNFITSREYEFTFSYKGLVQQHGLNGTKRRDVCSNDGPAETNGVACTFGGIVSIGSNLTLTDSSVSSFAAAGVNIGDMVINKSDGDSRGIIISLAVNSLTVASLNGGAINQFASGDTYEIHLIENLNDDTILDNKNDDLATITIRDRDGSGTVVGSAQAKVPPTGTALASMYVQDVYTDLEVQYDASDTTYDLPLWFTENMWHRLMYVAASGKVLPSDPLESPDACTEGADCLAVDGLTPYDNKEVLVIAAGPELSAFQDRLSGTICGSIEPSFFCDYFEGENADFDFDEAGPPPPTFEHTPIGDTFNDQIKIVEVLPTP